MHLVLVEGLPGTGKTTLAERLCAFAVSSGRQAVWHREEDRDHPVHPASLTMTREQPGFASRCLQSWNAFAERVQSNRGLCILEGSAFQSTVRFLMEQESEDAHGYVAQFEHLVRAVCPAVVYLRPADTAAHTRGIAAHRGAAWSTKVSRYLEKTRYSLARKLHETEGMHRFWSDYAELCDGLFEQMSIPKLAIAVRPPDIDTAFRRSIDFLETIGHIHRSSP
ncbi:AAA family ATPase [Variovorax sp. J2P1-59]|uniref:AAA family ATPase n=1 Tax=Variovorax flavidus TaxID=3053501 RepID=UPI002575D593|nr:AAA family ATPase [Variovorax sp. J2P1-59]MDM0078725.1 AAA family ATPase [Variovorax sp. J2P1-59]